jgi:integrase
VRFPKTVRHRKAECKIYGKSKHYPFYRVCGYVAGRRRMTSFATYSEAKTAADKLVRELASGSQASALTAKQARDALAALEVLQGFYQSTGKRISLHGAAVQFTEAASKLKAHSLTEAVDGFLESVVTVKRISVHEAIEQFIAFRKGKTLAAEGRRPQLSEDHWRNTGYWLREFAEAFPGNDVCDLTKQHLDAYMTKFAKAAPKTRNERRGVVKMFLAWAVEQDYLRPSHRLAEASQLKHENADVEVIECYTARELRVMLERATKQPEPPNKGEEPEADYRALLPVLALAGLAGMREKEIMRLTWQDVFRVPGHIEVGALKSKTRSRRLIEVCASLGQWLEPYRGRTGSVCALDYKQFHEAFLRLRGDLKIQHRRNGLRHSFVSAHYAMHGDEGRTAQQAGNSPAMVHKNYKGLMTKKDGEAWFAVSPSGAAKNVIPMPAAADH